MAEDKDKKKGNSLENENREKKGPQEENLKNPGESTNNVEEEKAPPGTRKEKRINFDTRIEGDVKDLDQAEKIYKFNQKDVKQFFLGEDKRVEIKRFSLSDAIPLSKDNINALQHFFIYPEDKLDDLTASLMAHRILLLTGESESGKYLIAKYLSFRMMKQSEKDYYIRGIEPLARDIDIELMELIKNPGVLKENILIFKNVFSKRNQNLIDFLLFCSREQLEFISGRLSQLDAFILFTADNGTFDQYTAANLHIKKAIYPLDHSLLQKAFELKLKHFCSLSPERDFDKSSEMLACKKAEIIDKLGRMSKIVLFIENYLDRIVFDGKLVDDAIEEVNDMRRRLEHWFLKELGMNKKTFETWCFALCLAIFNHGSYADFIEVHREITVLLLKKLDPFHTFKDFTFTLSERELLETCRAQITKDVRTHADRIEFCDPGYQQVLMDILLSNNRKVLLHIVPFLKEYVENHHRQDQRRFGAFSLARIGAADPEVVIFPIIDRWAHMQSNIDRANVGYLYETIFDSKDEIYKTYCMRKLKAMALSSDIDEQLTAIAAYKQIGLNDLGFAMAELRKIQEEAIDLNVLDFVYTHANLLDDRGLLANLERIYEETVDLLSYVRYSIVALSIISNPINVLDELRKWIHKGNRNSRVNVVLFFLGPDGILKELEVRKIIFLNEDEEEDKKKNLRTNPLLHALAAGDESVKKMAIFYRDLYKKCFSEFRMDVNHALKTLLFGHLEVWAVDSLGNSKINNALKKLIVQFYNSGDDELRDTLWDSINRWKAPEKKEEHLKAFIDETTRIIFNV